MQLAHNGSTYMHINESFIHIMAIDHLEQKAFGRLTARTNPLHFL